MPTTSSPEARGWQQAVELMEPLVSGLEFALKQLEHIGREHPGILPQDRRLADQFDTAEAALRNGQAYLAAMRTAVAVAQDVAGSSGGRCQRELR